MYLKSILLICYVMILSVLLSACTSVSDNGYLEFISRNVEGWFIFGLFLVSVGCSIWIFPNFRYYAARFFEWSSAKWILLFHLKTHYDDYRTNIQAGFMVVFGLILIVSSILIWIY